MVLSEEHDPYSPKLGWDARPVLKREDQRAWWKGWFWEFQNNSYDLNLAAVVEYNSGKPELVFHGQRSKRTVRATSF